MGLGQSLHQIRQRSAVNVRQGQAPRNCADFGNRILHGTRHLVHRRAALRPDRLTQRIKAQGGKAHLLGGTVMQVSPNPPQGLIVHRRKPRRRTLHTQPQGDIAGRKLGQGRQLAVNRARSAQHNGKQTCTDDQHHQRHRGPAGQARAREIRLQLGRHLIELGHGDHPAGHHIADR